MRITSPARTCLLLLQPSPMPPAASYPNQTRQRFRKYSQRGDPENFHKAPRQHVFANSPINPINVRPRDAVDYLHQLFTPLEFPEDVAQRMTTHVSWERGTEGHNGRLSFIGRRVLHTYLLLFLHECLLPSKMPQQRNTGAPSDLRASSLSVGGDAQPLPQTYEHISDKLLDTYVLGEHVGGAWHLERIMRWTPAVAQLNILKATDPSKVLHGSGLYKVRGATVEGVMGGIFHQFGGSVAHRVFHTRVLPHIFRFGLPQSMYEKAEEACERFGGIEGLLLPERPDSSWSTKRSLDSRGPGTPKPLEDDSDLVDHEPVDETENSSPRSRRMDYVQMTGRQKSLERQKLGYTGNIQ